MMPRVIDVLHAGSYKVWLRFADGLSGEIDLADQLWGAVFEPLKDIDEFAKVRMDAATETIAWPNGADFSPTWLYERLQSAHRHRAEADLAAVGSR